MDEARAAEDHALGDQRRGQERDADRARPAVPVPPDRARAAHDRTGEERDRAPDRRRVRRPDRPEAVPEDAR